jgi:glycosyltransferase involved in cell wall biosynthesis
MSRRPRILISLAAWTRGASGGDQHVLASAARWSEAADVVAVCPQGAGPLVRGALPEAEVRAFRAPPTPSGAVGLSAEYLRRMIPAARAARRAGPVDAAVAGSHFLPDAAALAAARAPTRAVFVYHLSHGKGRPASLHTALALAGERAALLAHRAAANLAFVSNRETGAALRRWPRVARTNVGIDLAPYRDAIRPAPRFAACFLGRLVPTKGPEELVRAWAQISARRPGERLVVVGVGPSEPAARALATRLGVAETIEWAGFVDEDRKRELLAASRLLIFPSHEEGWGIAVCEALAAGTPAVCFDLPILRELFGPGIVTVPVGDWSALGAAAAGLLEDEGRRAALGDAGRELAQRYDVERIAREELGELLPGVAREAGSTTIPNR